MQEFRRRLHLVLMAIAFSWSWLSLYLFSAFDNNLNRTFFSIDSLHITFHAFLDVLWAVILLQIWWTSLRNYLLIAGEKHTTLVERRRP